MGSFLLTMAGCYLFTILIETSVLLVGLSRRHPLRFRIFAGVWLTACTYPVVWILLPPLFTDRVVYLGVAEVFAPVAECLTFWLAFIRGLPADRRSTRRDMIAITLANLASFGLGELIWWVAGVSPHQ